MGGVYKLGDPWYDKGMNNDIAALVRRHQARARTCSAESAIIGLDDDTLREIAADPRAVQASWSYETGDRNKAAQRELDWRRENGVRLVWARA